MHLTDKTPHKIKEIIFKLMNFLLTWCKIFAACDYKICP